MNNFHYLITAYVLIFWRNLNWFCLKRYKTNTLSDKTLSDKSFVGQNFSSDKNFATLPNFGHFCPAKFCPIRYINRNKRVSKQWGFRFPLFARFSRYSVILRDTCARVCRDIFCYNTYINLFTAGAVFTCDFNRMRNMNGHNISRVSISY